MPHKTTEYRHYKICHKGQVKPVLTLAIVPAYVNGDGDRSLYTNEKIRLNPDGAEPNRWLVGMSLCCLSDKPSRNIGRRQALNRALDLWEVFDRGNPEISIGPGTLYIKDREDLTALLAVLREAVDVLSTSDTFNFYRDVFFHPQGANPQKEDLHCIKTHTRCPSCGHLCNND